MKTRIISAVIGVALLLVIVISNNIFFDLGVLILSLVGLKEYDKAVSNIKNIKIITWINYILAITLFLLNFTNNELVNLVLFAYVIILLCFFVLRKGYTVKDISMTMLGGLYIPFFFYHMYLLKGSIYIWIIFISAFSTDTFAYFAGMFFGKNKLCPDISPKKTIEGSIGGIVGCLITILIFSIYFEIDNILGMSILAIILSIMSQVGDLTASKIKREAGIKDYGKLMPGHGGVLDRFDSILFATPIVYYYITYLL